MRRSLGCVAAVALFWSVATVSRAAETAAPTFTPDPATVVRYGPAYKYPQHGWLVVHIEGEPYERGVQHGRLLAEEIVDHQKTLAAFRSAKDPVAAWRDMRLLTDSLLLRGYKQEYLEEMQGIADGASSVGARIGDRRLDVVDIAAINSFIEIEMLAKAVEVTPTGLEGKRFDPPPVAVPEAPEEDHCSAFAANGAAVGGKGLVFGHITMFALPVVRHYNVWLDVVPAKGHRVVMQGYAGAIQSGLDYYLNSAGILITETTIAQTTFNPRGTSVVSRIREAAQYADSIDKAVELLKEANNGLYTNEWILADVKTGETAMFELGTSKTKLWRSGRNEWPADTTGFYWGCNNAKDPALRLETLAATNDRPANVLYFPKDRDQAWLRLYDKHKGRIAAPFGFEAFGQAPIVGYSSCDAKFTDAELARELRSWAIFGPPLGRTWMPKQTDYAKHPDIRPLVANDWTVLGVAPPALSSATDDKQVAAVDLRPFRKDDDAPKAQITSKLPPAWRGTLLPKTDADIWLSVAFAEYEKIVALEKALNYESAGKPLSRRAQEALDVARFKKWSDWQTAVRRLGKDVPLSKLTRSWTDQHWHRIALGKGSLFLHGLREEFGPEKFDKLMDEFGAQYGGGEVTTERFVEHVNRTAESKIDFLAEWWHQSEFIDYREDANPWTVDSFEDEPQQALIVYGTQADKAANREAVELLQKNVAARWHNFIVPAKADVEMTDDELSKHHVLLIGRPATNSVLQRFGERIPGVKFGPQSFVVNGETYAHPRSALLLAAENPLSKRYSLVIYAGLSADATWHAVQAFPDCGGKGAEAIILAHGAKARPIVLSQK
jgi:hypothetical protein